MATLPLNKIISMSIKIRIIPTLKGRSAERFTRFVSQNVQNRGSVDFSKEVKMAQHILEKSEFKG